MQTSQLSIYQSLQSRAGGEEGFAPYYSPLIPILKQYIQAVLQNPKERTLLGRSSSASLSLLAKASGLAGFRADAEGIVQATTQAAQIPNLPSNHFDHKQFPPHRQ